VLPVLTGLAELRPALAGEKNAIYPYAGDYSSFRNRRWQSPGRYHNKLPNSPVIMSTETPKF
jgi:hypothetical protein